MTKRKHLGPQVISTEETPMYGRIKSAMDLNDKEWSRRLMETRKPSVGYWITITGTALTLVGIGILQITIQSNIVKGTGFLIPGMILSILIIKKITQGQKGAP